MQTRFLFVHQQANINPRTPQVFGHKWTSSWSAECQGASETSFELAKILKANETPPELPECQDTSETPTELSKCQDTSETPPKLSECFDESETPLELPQQTRKVLLQGCFYFMIKLHVPIGFLQCRRWLTFVQFGNGWNWGSSNGENIHISTHYPKEIMVLERSKMGKYCAHINVAYFHTSKMKMGTFLQVWPLKIRWKADIFQYATVFQT